jgi:hypothetical protein
MVSPLAAMAAAALALSGGAAAGGDFSAHVNNPYFPLKAGMRWEYRGVKDGHRLRDVITVTSRVERIGGVPCAVVRDQAYLDGRLRESTIDWYSQDANGTVWYFGEDTKELDRNGRVTSTEGSWRAGVDGARQGVFMPAHPRVGQAFAQEHYAGHAEDHFKVLSRRATVAVPYRTFAGRALMTREWTPLEPGVVDRKWYVRGIGEVKEETVKGGDERAELVSFRAP